MEIRKIFVRGGSCNSMEIEDPSDWIYTSLEDSVLSTKLVWK